MKRIFALLAVGAIAVVPLPAYAGHEAVNLPGSARLTWQSWDSIDHSANPVGYLCLIRGSIQDSNGDVVFVDRYGIVPEGMSYELLAVNAASITRSDSGEFVAVPTTPTPVATLWEIAPTDDSGEWFAPNAAADGLGRACVNGGISGAVQHLERTYGTPSR